MHLFSAWLVISLPDSRTLEVEPRDNVTLSCTNVSDSPTLALWMRVSHTSEPIIISSVYKTDSSSVRYMDGFKQGRYVLKSNLFFINLTILQVVASDSGLYFCMFLHKTPPVIVNSTFLKIHGKMWFCSHYCNVCQWISSFIKKAKNYPQILN